MVYSGVRCGCQCYVHCLWEIHGIHMQGVLAYSLIIILVMCSVSTNGEQASLENLKLTIGSLLECSLSVKSLVDRLS